MTRNAATDVTPVAERVSTVSPLWRAVIRRDIRRADNRAPLLRNGLSSAVEMIYEGYALHYGTSRVVDTEGGSLPLLIGDWCYAAGLCDVADAADLDAIATLANLIAEVATRVDESADAREMCWDDALATLQITEE